MTREEAKNELVLWRNRNSDNGYYYKFVEALTIAIKALEQEPREGHWVIKDNMWWVCSDCGCQTRMMKKYNVPNFCPACGARMVEPQESEEV